MKKLLQLQLIKNLKDKAKNDDGSLKDLDFNKKHDASSIGQNIQSLFNKIADKFKGPRLDNKENQLEKQFSDKQTVKILQIQTDKLDDINKTLIDNQKKTDKHFKELIQNGGGGRGGSGGGLLSGILGLGGLFGASKLMAGSTGAAAAGAGSTGAAATGGGLLAKGGGLLAKAAKFALPSLGLGVAGEGAKYGLDRLADKAFIAGNEKTGKALKIGGEMAKYAGWGAGIGRFAGPMGMAIGGGVGALVGAGKGIYKNVFSQEQRDNIDKSTTNESMLGFNTGGSDMLSAAAWGKNKKDKEESIKESSGPRSQTFKSLALYQADEDLYNEFNDRKKELEKKEYEKIISQYKNPTAHNELIARNRASGRSQEQAMDEFAIRAEKVGAATIHEGRDYYKEQEEAYLNRNTGEEKKEEKSSFLKNIMGKVKYGIDKLKFNYNAGIGRGEEYENPDFQDKVFAETYGSASDEMMDSDEEGNGIKKTKSELKSQSNFKKTILGSELLGKWFSKKGIETGGLMGDKYDRQTASNTNLGTESDSALNSSILGSVKSGGLFGKDKYIIDYAQKDAERVYDGSGREQTLLGGGWKADEEGLEVTKDQYEHVEKLVADKKIDEAVDYVSNIRREQMLNSPSTGDIISEASSDVEMAKMDAQKSNANIVNAPTTTNVSNQNNNSIVKSTPQNEESSINKYIGSLWSM